MLKLDVFAGTIGNLTDARYFAAREAKWLGFNLDQMNPSSVSEMEVNAIKGWLDGVKIVGEFGDVSNEEIKKAIESLELDAILAGPFTSKDAIESVEVPVFKEIVIEPGMTTVALKELMEQYEGTVAHFVLDFDKNKVHPDNSEFTKEFLQDLSSQYSIIVSFPWEVYEIGAALEDADWSGILMRGGEEEKVGFKSFDDLDELLDYLEIEEEF
jgi:phosphoribosylanthranilate isomerase